MKLCDVEIFYISRVLFSFFDRATLIRVTLDALFRRNYNGDATITAQYKYHTVLSLHAKTIVTCVRIF